MLHRYNGRWVLASDGSAIARVAAFPSTILPRRYRITLQGVSWARECVKFMQGGILVRVRPGRPRQQDRTKNGTQAVCPKEIEEALERNRNGDRPTSKLSGEF
jgi:hypothetical protein